MKSPTMVFARKHPVSDRECRACGARLNFLGDTTCWFEVWRVAGTGELKAQEYHLRCDGEKRRHHGAESAL
jgi:hypothetical protein